LPLSKLIAALDIELELGDDDALVSGITCDSRNVKPGYLFVAISGSCQDGTKYIDAAVHAGACAIVSHEKIKVNGCPVIKVDEPRKAYSLLCRTFYHRQPKVNVAVTGTNGKTSVVHFTAQLGHLLGIRSASIGTIGVCDGQGESLVDTYSGLTTPPAEELHALLANIEVDQMAFEASSHGLSQYRLHGVDLNAAAFTNFSRDHLDYHKTEQDYFNAKMILFSQILPDSGVAVINADDPKAEEVQSICHAREIRVVTFGESGDDIKIKKSTQHIDKQVVIYSVDNKDYEVDLHLIGKFQASNVACAIGLLLAVGHEVDRVMACVPKLSGVPGRMEKVLGVNTQAPCVVVDYSHTPDALRSALMELRPLTKGTLGVVFGCGGDRDKGKRAMMGSVAHEYADVIIVTDDNPRTEDPAAIRKEILQACPDAVEVADRKQAIAYALGQLSQDDVLLIAGKGHEQYQIIGNQVLAFDDKQAVKEAANG
tara:strand:- start:551 stop:1999 length:1449 start_codon:yes stop_codon:yes gene_type:complete